MGAETRFSSELTVFSAVAHVTLKHWIEDSICVPEHVNDTANETCSDLRLHHHLHTVYLTMQHSITT